MGDVRLKFCVIVAPNWDVFEFDVLYGQGNIKTQLVVVVNANWGNHTDDLLDRPYRSLPLLC